MMNRTLQGLCVWTEHHYRKWSVWQKKHRRVLLWGAWLLYVLIVTFVAFHHERWSDEAQAWLLARDASVRDLLLIHTHYEGPVLWHLLLKILTALHLPYGSMTVLSVMIASIGIGVFFRWSPFPLEITLLVPFTYFLSYQYAVIARSYVLLPVLLFGLMLARRHVLQKPAPFFCLLCILMTASIHAFLLSGSLFALHLLRLSKTWYVLSNGDRWKQGLWIVFFSILFLIVLMSLWPAPDYLGTQKISPIIVFLSAITLIICCFAIEQQRPDNPGLLLFLLLIFPQLLLMNFVYNNAWHEGILWLIILLSIGENESEKLHRQSLHRHPEFIHIAVLIAVLLQIAWVIPADYHDILNPYSGAESAASMIKEKLKGKTIAAMSYGSIAILPYFETNIFSNFHEGTPPSYFHWATTHGMDNSIEWMRKHQPDFLLFNLKIPRRDLPVPLPDVPHYALMKKFPGFIYWKTGVFEEDTYALYGRTIE